MSNVDQFFSLIGANAIVGGASRGIGHALAAGLATAGARVLGLGRSLEPMEAAGDVAYRACDLTDTNAFRACRDAFLEADRALDIYIHAAGITLPGSDSQNDRDGFIQTLEVNLIAAYHCCAAAAERMRAGGSIITVTSIGAFAGFPGNPAYVASKGGLRSLTKALAVDFGRRGIRVNSIAPGYIRTGMTERSFIDPERNWERVSRTILGRWGEPKDLVGAAIFLASQSSSYMTGQDLVIDGGWLARGL